MTEQDYPPPMPPIGSPINYATAAVDRPFNNLRPGGMVFGILAIIFGSLSGCMTIFMPVALLAPQAPNNPHLKAGTIISAMVLYAGSAVAMIWLGIGAIKMRRWVRPLMLSLGAIGLVIGLLAMVGMVMAMPLMSDPAFNQSAGRPSAAAVPIIFGITIIIMALMFVAVPAAFLWFYQKRSVKMALEYFDPAPRWTDRCPVRVLGMAVGLMLYAASMAAQLPQAVMPMFRKMLYGLPAIAVLIAIVLAVTGLSISAYRIRPVAWWGSLGLIILLAVSNVMNAASLNNLELMKVYGNTDRQIAAMQKLYGPGLLWMMTVPLMILPLCYLIYVRKFFFISPQPVGGDS